MKRDYIGYGLALITTVISLIASWYFYEKSIQRREPIFAVASVAPLVFDVEREKAVPLQVLRRDGTPLTKSVYVATHTFWNAGNLPITASDVLEPIVVKVQDTDVDLLSASIARLSRKVTGCSVEQQADKSFLIKFNLLEQSDGCQVKVFYSGPANPKYSISGEILGVKKLTVSGEHVMDYFARSSKASRWYDWLVSHSQILILWLAIFVLAVLYVRAKGLNRRTVVGVTTGLLWLWVAAVSLPQTFYGYVSVPSPVVPIMNNWAYPER